MINPALDALQPLFANMPDVMTAKELASVIRLNVKTIYSLVARGMIPYVRIGSALLFPKAQIIAWLEERNYRPAKWSPVTRS